MTLTKIDIANTITEELGFSRKKSVEVGESLTEIIKQTLATGEDLLISGFGKFCIKKKKKRKGRNPATGEDMILDKRDVVVFKCSDILRNKVN